MATGIGTTIRRARERKRLRQQDVAEKLGVSRATYDAWENDRAYPRSSIGALEELLEVDLSGARNGQQPEAPEIPEHLQRKIDALPPEERDYVMGLLMRPDDASEMPPD